SRPAAPRLETTDAGSAGGQAADAQRKTPAASGRWCRRYDRRMRFETVLFDLDGTVVDSGAIILASMRHATREVLGRDYSDEELLQTVGGPGLEAQMRALDPSQVERLVDVYRAHNEPLHDELEACAGMEDVLVRLHEEGRTLGIVTAKR